MISKVFPTIQPDFLHIYLAWVDAWLLYSIEQDKSSYATSSNLDEVANLFKDENIHKLLSHDQLMQAVHSFKCQVADGKVTYGGLKPPSCGETDIMSESYNPQTDCKCDKDKSFKQPQHICGAHQGMLDAMDRVLDRQDEWNSTDLFTAKKLTEAVNELILANTEMEYITDTCQGSRTVQMIPEIQAPDRRPNPGIDGNKIISNQLYTTPEQIKICTDAKYYGVIACGAGLCDEGLARAIADSCNDILIGDYCEAADAKGLKLLQQTGAAAISFLKLCNMAGHISDWQFENLAAYMIQCRVLGFFRDHSRPHLPDGIYGSRMTGLGVHRHIDVAAFHGVMTASIATGQQLTEQEFMNTVKACVYINDFVDFRGDILRKQRENPLLRGMKGNLCHYIDQIIGECLDTAIEVIESSEVGALVVMGYCNWAILGSHHKVYELLHGVKPVQKYSMCEYESEMNTSRYDRLVQALQSYGTLGQDGPRVTKKRVEMDKLYSMCRSQPETSLAWLADATRSLLNPTVLRQIVDVVHFQWRGDIGAVDYCP
ncbi:hypothetical protein N7456_008488 [Penicillium angulare]|uniref:Uncharacterized protein n=1 Tax=Penicillium angulare TaxID=116970 RepID=A0A9W9FCS2_9EURO|nr:hypothetical protein N7456_008488 [Penicillium angulare]